MTEKTLPNYLSQTIYRTEDLKPSSYRLAVTPDGALVLQGCYSWQQGKRYGHEWRNIPTVKLEEPKTEKEEPTHEYTLELPGGDVKTIKVVLSDRKKVGNVVKHHLCVKVTDTNETSAPKPGHAAENQCSTCGNRRGVLPDRQTNHLRTCGHKPSVENSSENFSEESPSESRWRSLSLRFDQHRMSAIWHLQAVLKDPLNSAEAARKFLAARPTPLLGKDHPSSREYDRERFPDPEFNRWLDEPITENGEATVWDITPSIISAWYGWANSPRNLSTLKKGY